METYYVFEVYYKKGKYKIKKFETEDELTDYLILYIEKHRKYSQFISRNKSLYDIIKESVKIGYIVNEERAGYSIVKVITGEEIEEEDSSDLNSEESYEINSEESYDLNSEDSYSD